MNNEKKYMMPILEEMCKRVGADMSEVGWLNKPDTDRNWYMKHTWDKKDEADFQNWLADYFYANKETWRALYSRHTKTKKDCKDAAKWFVWQYGWVINEKE